MARLAPFVPFGVVMAFQACIWPGYDPSDLFIIHEGERLVTPP